MAGSCEVANRWWHDKGNEATSERCRLRPGAALTRVDGGVICSNSHCAEDLSSCLITTRSKAVIYQQSPTHRDIHAFVYRRAGPSSAPASRLFILLEGSLPAIRGAWGSKLFEVYGY
ncbi:hypothetical protein EYF80_005805 [Liparis tanakae]|uniref:Uncharacterized protein n=1 Tax=Liparis tanakae TaxID=230148 RepID=A0A4Z2J262_9TELE|nr:hypothetical protein EYF80_005805 [Liparis tanakae]